MGQVADPSVRLVRGDPGGHEVHQVLPSGPMTPSAPYCAPVSSVADSTIRVRTLVQVEVGGDRHHGVQQGLAGPGRLGCAAPGVPVVAVQERVGAQVGPAVIGGSAAGVGCRR